MNTTLIVTMLALIGLAYGATITNNNFAAPGDTITNNNDESSGLLSGILKSVFSSHKFTAAELAKHPKVKSAKDCPFGSDINNNRGSTEIFCLPEGEPSSVNNNN